MTIQYDGSNYSGWQTQDNAQTIQGVLITAAQQVISEVGGVYKDFQGAGRTDAGVHAYGQVAHLEATVELSPVELQTRLNALMPPSIHILHFKKAHDRFHARHLANSRQYVYRISLHRSPFERKYVCWVKESLDLEKMELALKPLQGFHDFASFSRKPKKEKSTQVLIEHIELVQEKDLILIRVRASHFLWNMVRTIVGAAVELGKGNLEENVLEEALTTYNPELKNYRMPASGLFLEEVIY